MLLEAAWLCTPDTPVSSTNKTYLYDIAVTEILLKMAFNNIITFLHG
jgi:hypothetical protein